MSWIAWPEAAALNRVQVCFLVCERKCSRSSSRFNQAGFTVLSTARANLSPCVGICAGSAKPALPGKTQWLLRFPNAIHAFDFTAWTHHANRKSKCQTARVQLGFHWTHARVSLFERWKQGAHRVPLCGQRRTFSQSSFASFKQGSVENPVSRLCAAFNTTGRGLKSNPKA